MGYKKLYYAAGLSVIVICFAAGGRGYAQEPNCAAMEKDANQITNLISKKEFLEKAVEQCSQSADLHYQLGYVQERLRKYDKALQSYQKAIELAPKTPDRLKGVGDALSVADYYVGLGDVLMITDQIKDAIAAYEKGLALDPKHERAGKQLEVARIKQKSQAGQNVSSEEIVKVMSESTNDRMAEAGQGKTSQPKQQVAAVVQPSPPLTPQAPTAAQEEKWTEVEMKKTPRPTGKPQDIAFMKEAKPEDAKPLAPALPSDAANHSSPHEEVKAAPAPEVAKVSPTLDTAKVPPGPVLEETKAAPPPPAPPKPELSQARQEELMANAAGPLLRMQVPFNANAISVDKGAATMLQSVGAALGHERLQKARFEIAGHSDDRGPEDYNMELSLKRAESVKAYLVEHFKIDPNRLTVTAYGKSRPLVPNTTNENRAMNRRVEFRKIN